MVRLAGERLRKGVTGGRASPGPFRADAWRSPIRGPWLTAVLSATLLVGLPVLFVTGLLSYAAYDPALGMGNDRTPGKGLLGFYLFTWPTDPVWLYRAVIGTHLLLGLALLPVVLAKLWSVIPKLFAWPPVTGPAQAFERLTLVALVGGAVFEFVTGLLNVQLFYPWSFSFYTAHLYGAWVFVGGLVGHVAIKLPAMLAGLRGRSLRAELGTGLADTRPEDPDESGLVAVQPAEPTVSRRAVLGLVGSGSALLVGLSAGQTLGDGLRPTALLAPRGGRYPDDFPVNKTARDRGIRRADTGTSWRLELTGPGGTRQLTRADLQRLEQVTEELPISCVEGWSTLQVWTGVRLRDLAASVGDVGPAGVLVSSLQERGAFAQAVLSDRQVADPRSLLALQVNGADLSLDHGFPARVIVPAAPGVHCTKWVRGLRVLGGRA
jgi:DMSO/TMAO reductase YedYZ molybdopterin-dependent catalytic subunit